MSDFNNICFICLKNSNDLVPIKSQGTNGASIEEKLKFFLPEYELSSNIPKYICSKCGNELSRCYEFKQKCLQNKKTYEKYAQQITTDGSYKYLSVIKHPNFVNEENVSDVNNYDSNILELKSEIDSVDIERYIIKEETHEESLLNIKLENFQSGNTCPDFVNKEAKISDRNNYDTNSLESNIEIDVNIANSEEIIIKEEPILVLDDKERSSLYEIKKENPESDDTYEQNKNIEARLIENENICEQREHKYSKKLCECKICYKSFKYPRDLRRHSLTHTGKKLFTCKICEKSVQDLKQHYLIHNNEKLHKCEICKRSFGKLNTLKRHCLIHNDVKPHTCEVCNKSFRQSGDLKKHKRVHTVEKPYTCEVCNESFRQLTNFKQHKLVHTGEKPFTCQVCNKSFRHLSTLKQHKLIHTDERPFICEVCTKSFRQLAALNNHKLIHTDKRPFACKICNKLFRFSHVLKRHKLTHTGEVCNNPTILNLNEHKLLYTADDTLTYDS